MVLYKFFSYGGILMKCFLLGFVFSSYADEITQSDRGFYVSGRYLYDSNGNIFLMRGINYPYLWFTDRMYVIDDIARTGANTVRIPISNGDRWNRTSGSEIAAIINRCKYNKVVCVLDVHDTMGYPNEPRSTHISGAVVYWLSDDIKEKIQGQEKYIIINIANEPFDNNTSDSEYLDSTINAIKKLRESGLHHVLMIDASHWGQDFKKLTLDNAEMLFASDPSRNTIFSVHMYEVYGQNHVVEAYMRAYVEKNLTLVIGEFGDRHLNKDVAEFAIMEYANLYGIGTIAWSWSGNTPNNAALDLVKYFDPRWLTSWGHAVIKSRYGIEATSKRATIFD